jgi:diguanylate cyclase
MFAGDVMKFRVTSWRDVFIYSALITALAVAVPLTVVSIALWRFPLFMKLPILFISGAIPFFITIPISIFAMNMFKLINLTVARLDDLIKFDAMTGLLNRTNFLHNVTEMRKKGGVLILLDADHFKKINDSHGHEAGDFALKYISNAMTQVVGAHGFVGRLGGEEFAIYLPQADQQKAALLMASLGTDLRNRFMDYNGIKLKVSLSMGIVVDRGHVAVATLLRRADKLLYLAKSQGRDCYRMEETLDEKAVSAA